MPSPTGRLLVGVSGGADSVSLALALAELGYTFGIAHLNHGLRGTASDEDEAFTQALAEQLHLPCFARKLTLGDGQGNIEAVCRNARRQFLEETASENNFTAIALAHTRDDRIETLLMNLLRGSGPEGLVSMAPVSGSIIRPLIHTSRADVEAYLISRKQSWQSDATNLDLSFTRNRLRHRTVPMLESEFNPRLSETLARTIEILQAEDDFMNSLTDVWLNEHAGPRGEAYVLDLAHETVPKALLRRIIRGALRRAGSSLQEVSFEHVESVAELLKGNKSGKSINLPGNMVVGRNFDQLIFERGPVSPREYCYELQIPGHIHIPELGKVFRADFVERAGSDPAPDKVFVDGGSLGPCVRIRNWKPGDYYRPVGLPSGKLKRLFQRARIPRSQRGTWPVLVADSTIVWVASFPVSREFAPGEHSQKIVAFEASPS